MTNIAVLGPKNTFTDLAAKKYIETTEKDLTVKYYSTIRKTFNAVGTECTCGIIPIENTIDGYVQVALDLLAGGNLRITHEVVLPIDFVFLSKKPLDDVKTIYSQFKTHNQCLNFLDQFETVDIVTTPSNGATYEAYLNNKMCDGVIVPSHLLDNETPFHLKIDHVADTRDNETRFLVLNTAFNEEQNDTVEWRSSFVVSNPEDRPGLLISILNVFAQKHINLKSIISRPRKDGLGNYNFYIDAAGCYLRNEVVREAVEQIMANHEIIILGSYYKIK